uniref:NADH-plastoquinone oxidoreductase subunit 7 n=1 Tax=Abies georgei var. smithii TaxID=2358304 RepID=A0A858YD78_9CONI|nr:NADH-plastoquinone oxidoreductase subunit 7 [Abies georgei var. smithii]QJU48725.1 NADH-plastoquinone oxidoreductase subunit 7 [Abies georgei var. smithii]
MIHRCTVFFDLLLDSQNVIDCEPLLYQIIYIGGRIDKIVSNRTIVQYLPYVTK